MSKRVDIRGEVHNSLLVLRFIKKQNSHALWKCKCLNCGKAAFVTYTNIVSGNSKSCASCGNRKLTGEQDKEISELYTTELLSLTKIAKIYDLGLTAIRNSLLRTKTALRKRGSSVK